MQPDHKRENSIATLASAVAVVLLLAGCATPASQQSAPRVAEVAAQEKLHSQVYVHAVTGGKDMLAHTWTEQIDNDEFKAALEQSLASLGYQSGSNTARFKVDVEQVLAKPGYGLNFTVKSTARYAVIDGGYSKTITVTVTGIARMADALSPHERVQIARERSIKKNIDTFITQLTDQVGK